MDKRLVTIRRYRDSLTSACKMLRWFFLIVFFVYAVIAIAIIVSSLLPPNDFTRIEPANSVLMLPIICNVTAGGVALLLLSFMFRKIALGLSPFCPPVSKALIVLGAVLLIGVISDTLITPGTQIGSISPTTMMTFDYGASDQTLFNFDAKSLLASVFCFALSIIFRYGTVLQNEADDLM